MSLLIKALQKAEQGKHSEDKAGMPAENSALELAPLPAAPTVEDTAADSLSIKEEPGQASQQQGSQQQVSRQAASVMFKAKSAQPASKRIWLIGGAGLLLLLGVAIGFYSYLESLQQPALAALKPAPAVTAIPPEPQVDTVAAGPATADPAPVELAEELVAVPSPQVDEPVAAAKPLVAVAAAAGPAPEVAPTAGAVERAPPVPRTQSQQLTFGAPVETAQANPVKITRNPPAAAINPTVMSAYQAFMAGNDAAAQDMYWQVLRADVRNIDALLGMAAIAMRQERMDDAAGWYGKVLEVEPRNTVAQAAMVSLLSATDPVTSESRIKNLLAQKPESAHLHAALGNLYAGQRQWPAAQQAYFDAYHFNQDNAEYAFNLAVSLDHLGKSGLALQYYKEARALLADGAAANIDRFQLESRIAQLQ